MPATMEDRLKEVGDEIDGLNRSMDKLASRFH